MEELLKETDYNILKEMYHLDNDNKLKIHCLKEILEKTDYEALKYAEGWFTDEEYKPIKDKRELVRNYIRQLEKDI